MKKNLEKDFMGGGEKRAAEAARTEHVYLEMEFAMPFSFSFACAAARRAIGTRNGEQLT